MKSYKIKKKERKVTKLLLKYKLVLSPSECLHDICDVCSNK